MRLVRVKELKTGMELAKPILHQGRILLNTGTDNLYRYKNRLMELGVDYVYINDDYSADIKVDDVIKQETRQESRRVIKKVFEDVSFHREVDIQAVKDVVYGILDELQTQDKIMVNLIKLNTFDSYTFSHSVNVAVLSLLLARTLKYNKDDLVNIGIGAMLHDVGKFLIPEDIINKPAKLTDEEFEIAKKHSRLGFEYLQDHYLLSPLSRIIVLSHHERIDGSGYPDGKKEEDIHEFAKLVAIADVFDALTSNRVYSNRWPVHKAVDYLLSNTGNEFEYFLVEKFVRHISVYPNGIEVKLSNGKRGIVREQNKNYPTRPIIDIIEGQNGEASTINLLNHLDIVIEDVI